MSFDELLAVLRDRNVKVWIEDGRLRYRGPDQAVDAGLLNELRQHKASLLEFLQTLPTKTDEGPSVPVQPNERREDIPLSYSQERLWFLHRLHPGLTAYNMPYVYRVEGPLDREALKQSLETLQERHHILRSVFYENSGQALQRIRSKADLSFIEDDFSQLGDDESEAALDQRVDRELNHQFDLEHGPLWRVSVVCLDDSRWALIFNFHHIIADGWSIDVFEKELSETYRQACLGQAHRSSESPIQYSDYAIWERQKFDEKHLNAQVEFWEKALSGSPEVLRLPVDYSRPVRQTFSGGAVSTTIAGDTAKQVGGLGRKLGASPFMIYLSAFGALLHRYSGEVDVVIGTPVANRSRPELAGLIGFFVNLLALRANFDSNPNFEELVQEVKQGVLEGFAHQELPFDVLVERLCPSRSSDHHPLFQVMFTFEEQRGAVLDFAGARTEAQPVPSATAKVDLAMVCRPNDEGVEATIEFNRDLFKSETIVRMLDHFSNLIDSIVRQPGRPVSELPLMDAAEVRAVVEGVNAAPETYSPGQTLHGWFEEQARKTPDAVALTCEGDTLTYRELYSRAVQLACQLREGGVRSETPVAICLERSLDLIVGILAILKSGATYVPIDPIYPDDRARFIIEDSSTRILLTQASLIGRFAESAVTSIDLDDIVWSGGDDGLAVEVEPEQAAYIIYTSGTTGRPKGTVVTHDNVVRLFRATERWYQFGADDVWTLFHSFAFDFSVWEIWGALLYGGRLVIVPQAVSRSPEEFRALLSAEGVTVLNQTPSAFRQLIQADAALGEDRLLKLRFVIFGGEALEMESLRPWFNKYGDQRPQLVNMYGITETTVHVTYRPLGIGDLKSGSVIGRPIPDLSVYILDRHQRPVPIGVSGELYVGGAGVARGYLNRPELTAERFSEQTIWERPSERLYRTGDLARFLEDGDIEYLGRIDQQVKIRGFRIELAEIEAVLNQMDGVRESTVMARPNHAGEVSLVGYIVATGPVPAPSEFRDHLKVKLPDYMIPATFVALDAIPLTANGKVDRKALPEPELNSQTSNVFIPPRGSTEELIAGLWSDLLGIPNIGSEQNFFEIGGHSLLATLVASRLREIFWIEVPLQTLFDYPRLSELAKWVDARNGSGSERFPPILVAPRSGEPPLSFAQQRLWFLDQLEETRSTYNIPLAIRFLGELDTEALQEAINLVASRHESLRTAFPSKSGKPYSRILSESDIEISVIDLADSDAANDDDAWSKVLEAEAGRPFDLAVRPPWRCNIISVTPQTTIVAFLFHHIITDGWSMNVFVRELIDGYQGLLEQKELGASSPHRNRDNEIHSFRGAQESFKESLVPSSGTPRSVTPNELEASTLQYLDFASWQRDWLARGEQSEQLAYWRERLAGELPMLELPLDHPRPPRQTYRGGCVEHYLDRELKGRLKGLAGREGLTLFMVMLGGFKALLHRYTGQQDLVVGTPVAGRNRSEVEDLIGLFVNTLVMRNDVSSEMPFRELLVEVKKNALGAYANQDIPFEQLVEELQPDRNLNQNPLFQVMFVMQNTPTLPVEVSGLHAELLDVDTHTAKFDLNWVVEERAGELLVYAEYNSDLFERVTVERWLGHYEHLLQGVCQNPSIPIGWIEILPAVERGRLVEGFNQTQVDYAGPNNLVERIEAQVQRTPDQVAVAFENSTLTYRELNERANQTARLLRSKGLDVEKLVGVFMERSLEMVVALVGILKSGAAYVPLDPTYPKERLGGMIDDAQAHVIVTQPHLKPQLDGTKAVLLELDGAWDSIEDLERSDLGIPIRSNQLAYMIFTSGSTGRPKGAMNEHGGICNRLLWMQEAYQLGSDDRVLQKTPFSFDVSVWEFFLPLMTGATLVVAKPDGHRDSDYLVQTIQHERITVIHFVPSMLEVFLQAKAVKQCRSLRLVVCSGEALSTKLEQTYFQKLSAPLENLYGPTEAAVDVTRWSCQPQSAFGSVPIGKPIANLQLYVLDRCLNPVPIGVPGELFLGGVGVGRGYWRRPDLTAERFIPDCLGETANGRLYRTGDLVKWLPDGNVEYLGRLDHQVKVRGLRIELGEIEAALRTQSEIREAVVIVSTVRSGDARLIAYVVGGEGDSIDLERVSHRLGDVLPDYMVPDHIEVLKEMPLSPNGKINRKALPEPVLGQRAEATEYIAPRTAMETLVSQVWSELIQVERIGINDGFFRLGGHSLLATQVVSRLREELKIDLALRLLFEHPVLEDFARRLEDSAVFGNPLTPFEIPRLATDQPAPMSFAQQRLWFLDRFESDGSVNVIPAAVRLKGELNVALLSRSLSRIVQRHAVLRTRLGELEGEPVQLISDATSVDLAVEDISTSDELEKEDRLQAVRKEIGVSKFDLEAGPLYRMRLLRLSDREHVLVVSMHHAISDGWSTGIFFKELAAHYESIGDGSSAASELPIQYGDYAAWQRAWLESGVMDRQLDYWRSRLEGHSAFLELPGDRPRTARQTFVGGCEVRTFDGALSERVREYSEAKNTTPFVTLLGAFKALLYRYTEQDDILVGTPIAGRTRPEFEGLIGLFLNTLVLRSRVDGRASFSALVEQVHQTALGAYANQDLPFERLVEELKPVRDLSHTPIFQIMFVLQNTPGLVDRMGALEVEPVDGNVELSNFDLTLEIQERDGRFSAAAVYNRDLFDASTMERFLVHYESLLENVVNRGDESISSLSFLTADERRQLLVERNDGPTGMDLSKTVVDLFREQALLHPDKTAVRFGEEALTYAELDRESERFAGRLLDRGVGPEVLVGLCVHRSIRMLTCLLGILKTGGAYVPLDPIFPEERIQLVCEDAQIRFFVTEPSVDIDLSALNVEVLDVTSDTWGGPKSAIGSAVGLPSNVAYVIFTSGSTGRPKGVAVQHEALTNFLLSMAQRPGMVADDVLLAVTTVSFDIAALELYLPLICGGTVAIASQEEAADGHRLVSLVERHSIGILQATPATWRLMLGAEWNGAPGLKMLCGGEAVPSELAAALLDRGGEFWNMYGPTETTIWSAARKVEAENGAGNIGGPIAATSLYVLDRNLEPVPIGVPGDLYIGGSGVVRGYHQISGMTASKFLPDPFSDHSGSRMYDTGDRVRWKADGALEFLGRADFQVKVRGYRIELGEIEALLAQHERVDQAVVISKNGGQEEARLIGYVVLKGSSQASDLNLKDYLRVRLPDYMVPARLVELETVPLTPNGKIDRKALPTPNDLSEVGDSQYVAPGSELEERLVEVWQEVLSVSRIGVNDNFFDLGGHSLLAMRIVSRLKEIFDVEVPLRNLFETPTIAQVASLVEQLIVRQIEELSEEEVSKQLQNE